MHLPKTFASIRRLLFPFFSKILFLSCAAMLLPVIPMEGKERKRKPAKPSSSEAVQNQNSFKPCYVTVCKEGNQLGGQLTTYAVILGYAWAHNLLPYFPKEQLLDTPGGCENYDAIFHRLPQELPTTICQLPTQHLGFPREMMPIAYPGGNICICGMPDYPLNYFHPFRNRIRELFGPSPQRVEELRMKFGSIIDHAKTVAVHVRAYDPRLTIHWCLGAEYFENAMNLFSDDHLFVIFSDRIDWCKEHLNVKNKNVIFIEGNDHLQDFYLMSLCKNIITANSTFSWWAAYLKKEEGGLILVPEKWFEIEDPAYRKTFYPSHYTILPVKSIPRPDLNLLNYETSSLGD